MGISSSFMQNLQTIYAEKIEKEITDFAAKIFKKVGLSHWSSGSKVMWFVLASILPFIAGFSYCMITVMLKCVNKYHIHLHDCELKDMDNKLKDLQVQIDKKLEKKTN